MTANTRGMGRVFQRGRIWWIAYYVHSEERRESARSPRETDAVRLLKKRIKELGSGRFVGPEEERVTFDDLATGRGGPHPLDRFSSQLRWNPVHDSSDLGLTGTGA